VLDVQGLGANAASGSGAAVAIGEAGAAVALDEVAGCEAAVGGEIGRGSLAQAQSKIHTARQARRVL
jgi:hypothetical protein